MFGRKKSETEDETPVAIPTEAEALRIAAKPAQAAQAVTPRPAHYAPSAAKPEPRKPQEHPRASSANGNGNGNASGNGNGTGHAHTHGNGNSSAEPKRLIVGRDIVLTGAINSCDKLTVDGRIEATLSDCREMEITETGTFKGEAAVDVALISGHFEGTLEARELLLVRAKGSVSGNVRFARLEVERGGELEGQVSVVGAEASPSAAPRVGANGNGAGVHDDKVAN